MDYTEVKINWGLFMKTFLGLSAWFLCYLALSTVDIIQYTYSLLLPKWSVSLRVG